MRYLLPFSHKLRHALKSIHMEEIRKLKQSKKFINLSKKSISLSNCSNLFQGSSITRISTNQFITLGSWVDYVSHSSSIKSDNGEAGTIFCINCNNLVNSPLHILSLSIVPPSHLQQLVISNNSKVKTTM